MLSPTARAIRGLREREVHQLIDRSASSSLRGYYYQFDKTILEILRQSDPCAVATVEGIEDVDLENADGITAIQCKYYASQRFHGSSLRSPISFMLSDYMERTSPIRYRLYVHFGEAAQVDTRLTVDRLKSLLTHRENGKTARFHEQQGITDCQLEDFIKHFTLELGPNYESQHSHVVRALSDQFGCEDEEASCHYYNNALRVIYDTAVRVGRADRRVVRREFLSQIDCSAYLFNCWYLRLKKKDEYIKYVRRKLREHGAVQTQKRVLVYIPDYMAASAESLGSVIQDVALARFSPGRIHDAKPLTFVLGLDAAGMTETKSRLLADGIAFNDGYESIAFCPRLFERLPLIYRQMGGNNRCTTKIDQASYYLRIVGKSTYVSHFAELRPPEILVEFAGERDPGLTLPNITPFRIVGCDVADLRTILPNGGAR